MSVTIAIPFYNAGKYLPDAIRSVFAQTYQDWELILIDDGSTDRSLDIAQSVNDPRVRVISDGKNKKLATRLNEVIRLAKYDYIARMDADDLMSPDRINIQVSFLKGNSNFDLISTGTYSILNDETLMGVRGESAENPTFVDIFEKRIGIIHASIVARKSWYERNKYNESLPQAQDTELWLQSSRKNDLKIKIIPDALYIYREEGNVTKNKLLKAYTISKNIKAKYIKSNWSRFIFLSKLRLKSFTVIVMSKFNLIHFLQKRRSSVIIDSRMIDDYNAILSNIKVVKVSGLDEYLLKVNKTS